MSKQKSFLQYFARHFFDKRFLKNRRAYFLQAMLAGCVVFLVLLNLTEASNDLVIASIASTAFFVFAAPHNPYARTKFIIGGYLIGVVAGVCCSLLMWSMTLPLILMPHGPALFGALTVFLSFLLMVISGLEHPPACAVSLALVLNDWSVWLLVVTVASLFIITVTRQLLAKYLINLM